MTIPADKRTKFSCNDITQAKQNFGN